MHGSVSGQHASKPNTPDVLHLPSSTADAHLLAEIERLQQENYALRVARHHASPQQAVRRETQQASAESHVIEDGERNKRQRRGVTGVKTLTALDGDSYAQVAPDLHHACVPTCRFIQHACVQKSRGIPRPRASLSNGTCTHAVSRAQEIVQADDDQETRGLRFLPARTGNDPLDFLPADP